MEEVGTADMVTAVAAVREVSGSKEIADPADHDLEVVGLEGVDLLVVAVAAVVVGALAAAVGFAAVVAALVQGVADSQAGPEGPADFENSGLVAVEAAAEEGCKVVVLAETVGAGYREADLVKGRGDLGNVGKGVLAAHVGQKAVEGGPAGGRQVQSYPAVGQGMEAAAGQGEVRGRADHSSPDSVGCSHLGPVVHRMTSAVHTACRLSCQVFGSAFP